MSERTAPKAALDAGASTGVGLASVDAYIASLPEGWRSYATCEARSALLASLEATGILVELEQVPIVGDHVRALTRAEWIPEVAHVAILLALRDRRFPGPTGEAGFVAWMDKLNRAVLPEAARQGASAAVAEFPAIWSSLHRGTGIDVVETGPNRATLILTHPEPIFPQLARRWRRRVIETHLSRAGASQPRAYEIARAGEPVRVVVTWG